MIRGRTREILRLDMSTSAEGHKHINEWREYVASHGLDPTVVKTKIAITQDLCGYHLHISVKTQVDGKDVLDVALNEVVSTPHVIHLGHRRDWPGA